MSQTAFANFLNSEKLSDIKLEFPIENKTLYAHKVILSVHSDVFNVLFTGPLATKSDTIQIRDCPAADFMEVLRFCYTNKFALYHTNVSQILHAANYYHIIDLEEHCCDFVLKDLDLFNACEILNKYFMYVNKLTEKCWRFIDDNISVILRQGDFRKLSKQALKALLKRDSLTCNEFELFKAVRLWAEYEIEKYKTSLETLADVFELIRFPTMNLSEFLVCGRFDSKLLNPQDFKDIKHYIESGELNSSLKYSMIQRGFYVNDYVEFQETEYWNANNKNHPPYEENMIFIVMGKIIIKSFEFIPHEKCKYGGVNYGIELSTLAGKILYKYESASPSIDCNESILLIPDVHYKLKSWENNHFGQNYGRFGELIDCRFKYSIFRIHRGRDDEQYEEETDSLDDTSRNSRGPLLTLHQDDEDFEETDSLDDTSRNPRGPLLILHQNDEDFDFPVNKTYLSRISYESLNFEKLIVTGV